MAQDDKRKQIENALENGPNLARLRQLAGEDGGLLDDSLRQRVCTSPFDCSSFAGSRWLRLIIGPIFVNSESIRVDECTHLFGHRDESQVELDVTRAFVYQHQDRNPTVTQEQLSTTILRVLRRFPLLCYFQGFHDVAQVFLLVLGPEVACDALAGLALLKIRDFMLPSFEASLAHLRLLPAILGALDPDLMQHLVGIEPYFALSATLTLYAHDLEEYADITRLYDYLLAQPSVAALYLVAAVILSRRAELIDLSAEGPDVLHSALSKLPSPFDLERVIQASIVMFRERPPESLPGPAWQKLSAYSVLKTTRLGIEGQDAKYGLRACQRYDLQIRRAEQQKHLFNTIWKYRYSGAFVLVGIFSVWLRHWHGGSFAQFRFASYATPPFS